MQIIDSLIESLLPGRILSIHVGISRTAVLVETKDGIRCGLAASLANLGFDHRCHPNVARAGHLLEMSTAQLTGLIHSSSLTEASIALAAINALLPKFDATKDEQNATDYLLTHAKGKNIALIGHFPFVDDLRSYVKNLWVLELNPRDGDLPAEAAPQIIPEADYLAVTATTLVNQTFNGLISLCREDTTVMMLGPTTPLSPVMFEHGVDILSGTEVIDPQAVMLGIAQGASTHQLKQAGSIKYVSIYKNK